MRWWTAFFLFFVSAVGLAAQSSNLTARVVGLEQDIAGLRRDLGAMRIEMESLIRENRALRQTLAEQTAATQQSFVTSSQLQDSLRALESHFNSQSSAQKNALLTEVSAEIKKLAEQTQTAINALAKSIEGRPSAPQVVTFSDNYPKSGVNYTVQPGDSLGKIAQSQNSRVQWIRDANRLASDLIYPNQDLFIPQGD